LDCLRVHRAGGGWSDHRDSWPDPKCAEQTRTSLLKEKSEHLRARRHQRQSKPTIRSKSNCLPAPRLLRREGGQIVAIALNGFCLPFCNTHMVAHESSPPLNCCPSTAPFYARGNHLDDLFASRQSKRVFSTGPYAY
jgi:hypothetical protein